ncbi:benzoate membrane transport protein [Salmonella enterica]|uniref:Benzoate membrane transport protein n=1 Tax=Salmonella enterica TaxID=28901 RepID=A0A7D8EKD7_SALER|nr:benzoate membrane transport protein [Salmonella enterica]
MRLLSLPLPTVLSGLVAVLVGYASSAAIIWQAALAAGATPAEIAGWMTALGIAMGISTLTLTLWYRAPVLTAWSTPGAALLVTGLQGLSLPDAVGIFIVANALIVLCGVTGLFARFDADNPPFSCRCNAGGNTATLRPAGVRDAQRRVCHVRRYAIGVATL